MKPIMSVDIQVSIVGNDYIQHYANISIPAQGLGRYPREERVLFASAIIEGIRGVIPALFVEAESKRLDAEQAELLKKMAPSEPVAVAAVETPF